MNMDNLDEEEKARHKQEKIEYRNKKRFSSIFLFIATVFEIIETFLIILLLIIGSVAITTRFVDVNSALFSNILGIIIIVFSLGGLIIGFIIYKKHPVLDLNVVPNVLAVNRYRAALRAVNSRQQP